MAGPAPTAFAIRGSVCLLLGGLVVASVPLVTSNAYYLFLLTFAGIYLLAAIGYNVVAGYTGIISLAHGALVCLGAYTTAILTVSHGWPFWPAALASMAVGGVASAIVSLPALRLSSWYFVLITIVFTTTVTALVTDLRDLTGGYGGIVGVPAPALFAHKFTLAQMFWLVVALNVAAWWVLGNIVNSRIGWSLRAVRDSSITALANGVSVAKARIFAFVFAGAAAGLAGALFAVVKEVVTPEDFPFSFSIFFLFIVVLGGSARLSGPLLGVIAFYIAPELLGSLKEDRMVVYGLGLLAVSVFLPEGIAGKMASLWEARRAGERHKRPLADPPRSTKAKLRPVAGAELRVQSLTKRFGGVIALDGVSTTVAAGSIHAIVGPNGSGKTTFLNLVSGLYRTDGGSIHLGGVELVGLAPQQIARLGVRRTFQTPKLLGDLTVLENIRFGAYDQEASSGLDIALTLPRARREAAAFEAEAFALLALVGLSERAGDRAADLPHGQQRLVEIARALAGRPRLLLLDEPAAGLSMGELKKLGAVLQEIRRLGFTVVIVEHHIELVLEVAQAAMVLDYGRLLVEGSPQSVFRDEAVVKAYTGARA
jgi:branched-chain amino acid transport system permease protein